MLTTTATPVSSRSSVRFLILTEDLHHDTLVNALGEQESGRGVPGVMHSHLTDSGHLEQHSP